jgi:hypothetical protein
MVGDIDVDRRLAVAAGVGPLIWATNDFGTNATGGTQ